MTPKATIEQRNGRLCISNCQMHVMIDIICIVLYSTAAYIFANIHSSDVKSNRR